MLIFFTKFITSLSPLGPYIFHYWGNNVWHNGVYAIMKSHLNLLLELEQFREILA